MEDFPLIPPPNASRNVQESYEKWTGEQEGQTYILASLNNVLAKKHELIITAHEIMESLRGMFGQSPAQLRHDTLNFIFNSKMKEGLTTTLHATERVAYILIFAEKQGEEVETAAYILNYVPFKSVAITRLERT
ncbi:uncharacterized protein LOC120079789 [Benincasa hispida]|uniref:uncharacterized protein LOC120079789 n=1 Tax=Benincasa hispida TaxID=102211 RepID=UPI0019012628|nr:uncharacterized protein LOC120079789 [Benincasa hispida]